MTDLAPVFGQATRRQRLAGINWLGDAAPKGWELRVIFRSTRAPVPAMVRPEADGAGVTLLSPDEGVAPGQACVFYAPEGGRVFGGGWIKRG